MPYNDDRNKPKCPCCNGNGMHQYRGLIGAASPADDDIECSLCNGTGGSWFEARPNSCSGYRDLMRNYR